MPGAGTGADVPNKRAEADAYSLSTQQNEFDGDQRDRIDETTTLLRSDSHTSAEQSQSDSWDGYKEYAHLPWYKQPSVCISCLFFSSFLSV